MMVNNIISIWLNVAFLCSSNLDSDTLIIKATAAQKLRYHYERKDSDYHEIR